MTLDEAFEQQGTLVGVWDHYSDVLGAYSVGAHGAKLLRSAPVEVHRRDGWNEKLRAKGIPIGAGFVPSGRVWVLDSGGISLWSRDAQVLSGTRTEMKHANRALRFADVASVVCFVSPRGPGYRGVRCELHDGASVTLLDDDADTGFGPYFAEDLAKWILVRYIDEAAAN